MKSLIKRTRPHLCLMALLATGAAARAQLPTNFPTFTITTYDTNAVDKGHIFINSLFSTTNSGFYGVIVTNDGTPIWYQSGANALLDVKPLANGLLHYLQGNGSGQEGVHKLLDPNYTLVETLNLGNGYAADGHDIEVLPNGNVLVMGYYRTQMDLSGVVPGGYPNAQVLGAIIQELDAQRNVVWQWRSWDYFTFRPDKFTGGTNATVNTFHVNAVSVDNDGNLLASSITEGLILKLNRQTGDVMWRLGGPLNQFTFANEDPALAVKHFASHCVRRLANGNILLVCNGNAAALRSTKIYEYQLDEVNKVATLVWSHTPASPIYTAITGSAQRLPNGNTFIGWGALAPPGQSPACTEVTPSGRVVFEMKFNDPSQSIYRAFRYPWPPQSQAIRVTQIDLMQGNNYNFGAAGVSVTVSSGGGGYNNLTATREPYSPLSPLFLSKPPSVLPLRVSLSEVSLASLGADISFDAASFGFTNAANLTVYYRQNTGQGLFVSQPTAYNAVAGTLTVSMSLVQSGGDFGEFIFAFPDIPEVPYPPIVNAVETYRGVQTANVIAPPAAVTGMVYSVNQQLPIALSWSPKGFASYYELQVDTDPGFAAPVVGLPSQTDAFYVWSNALPATTYYYRVRTFNYGGTSSWSSGAFQTVAPFVHLTVPNGGEAWRRGLAYFLQWDDVLAENVKIDLFKGGVFNSIITTNAPSTGAFKWSIPSGLAPGSDYTVKITSVTNSAMSSTSAQTFSIVDAPAISGSPVHNPDGTYQFGFSASGASQVTVWATASFTPASWQNLGAVPVANGSGTFTTTPAYLFYRLSVP
jgi:hypothetical protein